jgi:hypothetical protein
MILERFVLPIAVAVITYFVFRKREEDIKRRQYSMLGVAIMDALLEEINNGIHIMKNRTINPLPVISWESPSTIPDDVLLRIIAVSKGEKPLAFKPQDIRIHCKNYFGYMAKNWLEAVKSKNIDQINLLLNGGNYIQAAEQVKLMVTQCRNLLKINSTKIFPK